MSDRRCDGCDQPCPEGWCDVCEFAADLLYLTTDQLRDIRDRIVAILDHPEARR